jgi:hypothetical protein
MAARLQRDRQRLGVRRWRAQAKQLSTARAQGAAELVTRWARGCVARISRVAELHKVRHSHAALHVTL